MTATMEDVQARLPEILDALAPGEQVIITRNGKPVAKVVTDQTWGRPVAGRAKGMLIIHAEDNEHLNDFAEYME